MKKKNRNNILVFFIIIFIFLLLLSIGRIVFINNNNNHINHSSSKKSKTKTTTNTTFIRHHDFDINTTTVLSQQQQQQQHESINENHDKDESYNYYYYYYSPIRMDRSGAVLQDMLMAHAYCYHHQYKYAGACVTIIPTSYNSSSSSPTTITTTNTTITTVSYFNWSSYIPYYYDHMKLIHVLGLEHLLKFHICPTPTTTSSINRIPKLLNPNMYRIKQLSRYWTNDWLHYIQKERRRRRRRNQKQRKRRAVVVSTLSSLSLATTTTKKNHSNQQQQQRRLHNDNHRNVKMRQIMVHIRRGDVTLCNRSRIRNRTTGSTTRMENDDILKRYVPNQYYINLLVQQLYDWNHWNSDVDPSRNIVRYHGTNITIFSERTSIPESWDEMIQNFFHNNHSTSNITSRNTNITNTTMYQQQYQYDQGGGKKDDYQNQIHLLLDTPPEMIWSTILDHADVYIMSRSSFSIIPALFLPLPTTTTTDVTTTTTTINPTTDAATPTYNDNTKRTVTIIAPPPKFWYEPLPHWIFLSPIIKQQQDDVPSIRDGMSDHDDTSSLLLEKQIELFIQNENDRLIREKC